MNNHITFNKDDIVIIQNNLDSSVRKGMKGIVLRTRSTENHNSVPIKFFEYIVGGHDCDGLDTESNSYYIDFNNIKTDSIIQDFSNIFIEEEKIICKDFNKPYLNFKFEDNSEKYLIKETFKDTCFNRCSKEFKTYLIKNEKIYPAINVKHTHNKDIFFRFEKVFIEKFGIKNFLLGTEMPDDVDKWERQKELTLYILPKGKNFLDMVNHKRGYNKIVYDYIMNNISLDGTLVDFNPISYKIPSIYTTVVRTLLYMPTKNIMILLVNPFYTKTILSNLYDDSRHPYKFAVKYRDEKEAEDFIYIEIWGKNLKTKISTNERSIKEYKQELESMSDRYQEYYNTINSLKLEMVGYKNMLNNELSIKLKGEIEKISKLPFIKNVNISHNIKIDFGKVYITHKIKTGKETKDGILVPKLEHVKIYIGEMYIIIENNKVIVYSKEYDNGDTTYPHPHVDNEGKPCFGSVRLTIEKKLVELEIFELTKLLFAWIISYNSGDAHKKIEYFYDKENGTNIEDDNVDDYEEDEIEDEDEDEDDEENNW